MSILPLIHNKLKDDFNPEKLEVIDESASHAGHSGAGDESHLVIRISSKPFEGKSRIDRERTLRTAVITAAGYEVHAIRFEYL